MVVVFTKWFKYMVNYRSSEMSFITASQIALCAAMLLGIIALSALLWRICTKPQLFVLLL